MTKYAKFFLGGKHFHYKGVNGQFANVRFGFGVHKFVKNEKQVLIKMKRKIWRPQEDWKGKDKVEIEDEEDFLKDLNADSEDQEIFTSEEEQFA